tara:strand:+ start:1776 stop:1964 length:189 start_codon:yes stop_codon:yes gene_type:complete
MINYKVEYLNNGEEIIPKSIKVTQAIIEITDVNGKKFGISINIQSLKLDEQIITALNTQYAV